MSQLDAASLEQLLELIGGDVGEFRSLADTFLDEAQEIVQNMQNALPLQQRDAVHRAAHSLKSGAQDFGAAALARECAQLEALSRSHWPEDAPERVDRIATVFAQVQHALADYVSEL